MPTDSISSRRSRRCERRCASARRPSVLTPHPLEAARLLAISAHDVQRDRLGAARTLAVELRAIVVLKGAGTVIAAPDGRTSINPTGSAALATAGTGDVLAGMLGALLAQGFDAWQSVVAAVWLHGAAVRGAGDVGIVAGDLAPRAAARCGGYARAVERTAGGTIRPADSSTWRPQRRAMSGSCVTITSVDTALPVQFEHQVDHRLAGARIEAAGRFVGEQQGRMQDEGARQRDPLLFAAAEILRIVREPLAESRRAAAAHAPPRPGSGPRARAR